MKFTLREYQEDALDRTAKAEARGVRKQLGVAATGLGKTVMFSALAERRGGRALVLVHRDELVSQAVDKMRQVWPEARVGIVKAKDDDVRADVVVASIQTLARPARLARLLAPITGSSLLSRAAPFELVIVDEAHHSAAQTYRSILEAVRAGEPERLATPEEVDAGCELGVVSEGPLLLGVTATPDRGDGKGLDDLFDEIVWNYDILWGIRSGYLSDVRGLRVTLSTLDLSAVKVSRGDYEAGAAGRALEDAQAPALTVAAWMEHALGRRTLVFTPTVHLASLTAAAFVSAGVAAGIVHGGTPIEERREILRDYSDGRIDVLCNCAVLTEGYDEPRTDCIVIARPTKSRALYTQMIGRGTRRHPDKSDLLVLDVVGASADLSLVTIPSLFGVDPRVAPYRDGDAITEVIDRQDRELVRLGRLKTEEAEMFSKMRTSGLAWVAVHRDGAALRRYVLNMGRDVPTVVLAQKDGGDMWTSGLQWDEARVGETPIVRKRAFIVDVPLETAQGVAEDWVRKEGRRWLHRVDTEAEWRKRKPTPKQIAAAQKWRIKIDPTWTAGQLSDAMNEKIAKAKG